MINTQRKPAAFSVGRPPIFYGWLLVALGFLAQATVYGIRNSFSVFYLAILDEFGWSRADTALIFSAAIVCYGLTAPVAGALVDRFGPRRVMPLGCLLAGLATMACSQASTIWQFVVLFGVLAAVGTCLTGFVPYIAVISHWFVRKRGLAFGVLGTGWGLSFAVVLLAERVIAAIGWRWAYLVLGGVALAVVLPLEMLLLRHRPQELGLQPDGAETPVRMRAASVQRVEDAGGQAADWTLGKAARTYRFWAVFLTNLFLWGIGENLLVAHQVAFAVDIGFSRTAASAAAFLFGLMMALSVVGGYLSDRMGRERVFSLGCSVAISAVAVLIVVRYAPHAWLLYSYAAILGLGFGLAGPALTASVADLFFGRHFGSINGAMVMGFGLGGSVGPWLGGLIFDLTGEYVPAFVVVAVAIAMAAGFLWLAAPRKVVRVGAR